MKRTQPILLCLFTLFLLAGFSPHQEDPTLRLIAKLNKFREDFPQEKVYVQLDRPYYSAGDTIRLKGYVVNAEHHQLSLLSKVLYVDLLDANDRIAQRLKIRLIEGMGYGNIVLSDSLYRGHLRLRAYTEWMRNFSDQFFFDRTIAVASSLTTSAPKRTNLTGVKADGLGQIPALPDLRFFPEGGQLIPGILTRIGFKATSPEGNGVPVTGYVRDEKYNRLASFRSEHAGMGCFEFIGEPGKKYTAVAMVNTGQEMEVKLPELVPSGYAIQVTQDSLNLAVRIIGHDHPASAERLSLLAVQNGIAGYAAVTGIGQRSLLARIPKSRFSTGIVQVTLLNSAGLPLAERLVFVRKDDSLRLLASTSKLSYHVLEEIEVSVSAVQPDGSPAVAGLAASVLDVGRAPLTEADEHTLQSDVLLTQDLGGEVEEPGYYFTRITEEKDRHLDHLMMTHGWRRYTWSDLAKDKYPAIRFQPEQGIRISGRVVDHKGKSIIGGRVTLLPAANGLESYEQATGPEGRFSFDSLTFVQGVTMLIQARTADGKSDVEIKLDSQAIPAVSTKRRDTSLLGSLVFASLEKSDGQQASDGLLGSMVMKEVKVSRKKDNRDFPMSTAVNGISPTVSQTIITGDQLMASNCVSLSECLKGRVANLTVENDKIYLRKKDRAALVVLDGYIFRSSPNNIPVMDIQTVQVLKSMAGGAMWGSEAEGGVILITTRKGTSRPESQEQESPGLLRVKPAGYSPYSEFYRPVYKRKDSNDLISPDKRKTIYWDPYLVSDANGKAGFKFYSASTPGTYRIVLEGLSIQGNPGRKVIYVKVGEGR